MKRKMWSWVAGVALATLPMSGCVVRGSAHGHIRLRPAVVVVESEPPPRRVVQAPPPRMGYVWVQGRWEWQGGTWVWVDGYWQPSRVNYVWLDGHWEARGGRWHWVEGRWETSGTVHSHGGSRDHRAP